MKEMLSNRINKKLRKNIPIDQQILALNKEEMKIKREMLKKMELQEQQFSRSMEAIQENFTNILSQSMQMMTSSFNPNPFQYRQVNHYQAPYHQQTGSSTQSFSDVGKVNHCQDPYYQHNQSVNSASSSGNNWRWVKTIHWLAIYIVFYEESFCFFNKET